MTPNKKKDVSWSSPKRYLIVTLDKSKGKQGSKSVFVDQNVWWERLGKRNVNTRKTCKTSHLRCFVSILQFITVKKKWCIHKFSMHFFKPTGLLWLFKQNPQPYITPFCTVLGLPLLRNSKNEICLFCSDFITLDINFKRRWNIGRWRIEFLPLYSPLIFLYLYWTIIELKKESKMCDKGLWKTFHLTDVQMFRGSRQISEIYTGTILDFLSNQMSLRTFLLDISGARKHSLHVI